MGIKEHGKRPGTLSSQGFKAKDPKTQTQTRCRVSLCSPCKNTVIKTWNNQKRLGYQRKRINRCKIITFKSRLSNTTFREEGKL